MASKLRTYAENELGVHQVYEAANKANGDLPGEHSKLIAARVERRRVTEEIADREAEILRDIRNTHTDLSATAHDQKAKLERRTDPDLKALRSGLNDLQRREDEAEFRIKELGKTIDIATARMIQLGGYLPFLFEIMKAEAVAPVTKP